jgi:hypothetical protein
MDARIAVDRAWVRLFPFFLFFILLSLLTLRLPFFWDKDMLFSRMAHWLLENRFSTVLPDSLDPGYPPVMGYLLAFAWKIFGISLPVAHAMMLPFTLGIVWQSHRLIRHLLQGRGETFALVLLVADTTLLAQAVVFSTDLVMLFFMLLALNAVIRNQRLWLAVAVTGLVFSHMRGIMLAAALGLFDVYRHAKPKFPYGLLSRIPPYLPALVLFAAWMVYHQHTAGWTGFHADSPWAPCYEVVDARGLLRNTGILVWRLGDFGRVFLWLLAGFLLVRYRKSYPSKVLWALLVLLGVTLMMTVPSMLIYRMLNGHRYLIPVFYLLTVLTAWLLFTAPLKKSARNRLAVLVLTALLSGNFWVYPDTIAKGWDATLAHLPYHHLRKKMIDYMDDNRIPVALTGSHIPNTYPIGIIELNGDQRAFHQADLSTDRFVFYSNVYNMFTDAEIHALKQDWVVEKEYRCLQVKVVLYKRRDEGRGTSKTNVPICQYANMLIDSSLVPCPLSLFPRPLSLVPFFKICCNFIPPQSSYPRIRIVA